MRQSKSDIVWDFVVLCNADKARGRFRSREPTLIRCFQDLVRLPDHNVVIPKWFESRKARPRFSLHLQYYSL
jgi:hypothetical protein